MSAVLFDGMALTVEVGFSTSAGAGTVPIGSTLASITWTDITSYVREVSTSRGRSSELDTYSAGSCSVVLDNRTRVFDPEYVTGAYYGKLTPLRPIRIRVTPSGGTIRSIFFGFVDQWPQAYTNPSDATVTVTASDAFKVLNMMKLPSYRVTTMTAAAPDAWYPLSDFNGSEFAFEIRNWSATSGRWRGSATYSSYCTPSDGLLANDPATSSKFDNSKWFEAWDILGSDGITPMSPYWSIQVWIQTTTTTPGRYAIFNHGNADASGWCGMVVDASGVATVTAKASGLSGGVMYVSTFSPTTVVNDGKPHLITLVGAAAGPGWFYVDGVGYPPSVPVARTSTGAYPSLSLGVPLGKTTTAADNFTDYFVGSMQDFAIWKSIIDAAKILEIYQVGVGTRYTGTRTDERIQLLLNLVQWPSDGTDLGVGQSTVLGVNTTDKGLLDALKECESAEQGRLFMSVDGKVKFVNRSALGSGTFITSQQTFSDAPTAGQIAYSDITLTFDDRYIYNDVTATQFSGNSYQATDATSQSQYFARTSKIDNLIVDTSYLLANTAVSRLNQYKQPAMRIDSMTIRPRVSTSYQLPCVTLDIGDRVTVTRTPQGVGAAITKTLIVEGVKHTITPDNWTVTFNTSPTNNAPFVLDSSVLGVLNTNILGY